jgi:hypothetical protein
MVSPEEDDSKQMIHMRLDGDLLKRLEDFRFANRFQTRTEAVRWLIEAALDKKLAPKRKD